MATHKSSNRVQEIMGVLRSFEPEPASYRKLLGLVARAIPSARALIVTTMPRGSTQITQPSNCPAELLRSYSNGAHAHDRATWQTILRNKAMNGSQLWAHGDLEKSDYYHDFMQVNGLA
jgi:hypothetical protein